MPGKIGFSLLAITPPDAPLIPDQIAAVANAGGASVAILLRWPTLDTASVEARAYEAMDAVYDTGAKLIIHENADLAQKLGVHGVHLPEREGSPFPVRERLGDDLVIGASRHDQTGVMDLSGADYATLSPVFESPGKPRQFGLNRFADAVTRSRVPVFALGGVEVSNVARCRAAGAAGVAAIRSVWSGDPAVNTTRLLIAWESAN